MEKILKILEENARISLEDIATMVESTPEEVAKQIDAYQQAHVINGYKALIDWDKAGADRVQAIIELRVSPKRDCGFDEVAANIARFDEVDSVMLMSGGYDLSLVMSGKSFQDIALFVAKRLSPLDDVLSTATHFVLRTYKKDGVLYGLEPTDERELAVMDYAKIISAAARDMRPSGIRKFFDIAAEMKDCISLGVGEPDFKTPWTVRDAGIRSLEKGRTWYTSNSGLAELREETCNYLSRRMGLSYTPGETRRYRGRLRGHRYVHPRAGEPRRRGHHPGAVLCLL